MGRAGRESREEAVSWADLKEKREGGGKEEKGLLPFSFISKPFPIYTKNIYLHRSIAYNKNTAT